MKIEDGNELTRRAIEVMKSQGRPSLKPEIGRNIVLLSVPL